MSTFLAYRVMAGVSAKLGRQRSRSLLIELAQESGLPAFTLTDATGAWKGTVEDSLVLEYLAPDCVRADAERKVRALAQRYCAAADQQSVLVSFTFTDVEFIGRKEPKQ